MQNNLTSYERFQLEKYGNVLPPASAIAEPQLFESGIEELDRLSEWIDAKAELELIDSQ